MPAPIFSVSGLRGVFGESLNAETVSRVIAAFLRLFGPGRYVVGRDARPSGPELNAIVSGAVRQYGGEVTQLGVVPTPTVVHFVRTTGDVRAGIVITASHNPIQWNGLKLIHPNGRFLFADEVAELSRLIRDCEARSVEAIASGLRPAQHSDVGAAIERHIAAIRGNWLFANVNGQGLRIGIDAVNGAMSIAACELVRAFGAEPVPIFCSTERLEAGFPRGPEPVPENLTALSELVRKQRLDAGFAFDPDGDRFSCVDEQGVALGEEASLCLAALYILPRVKGDVVVNLSTSRAIDDLAARFGVRTFRTRVGEANVVQRLVETGAVLGGEGNGGVILPAINLTRDGLVAAATVLALASTSRLSEIRRQLPEYQLVKTVLPAPIFDSERLLHRAGAIFDDEFTVDQQDGLRFAGKDWWVHIRQSNTEPVVRIVAEAKSRVAAQVLVNRVRRFLDGGN
ncbi:MAG: phosphoglucosamine mutase [candidate division WOR-3 bacterium]|jgi:phosphomannomutase